MPTASFNTGQYISTQCGSMSFPISKAERLLIVMITSIAILAASGVSTYAFATTTITTGLNPFGIDTNTKTNTIYVTNDSDAGSIIIINGNTREVVQTIPVEDQPCDLAVYQKLNRVYVASSNHGLDPGIV